MSIKIWSFNKKEKTVAKQKECFIFIMDTDKLKKEVIMDTDKRKVSYKVNAIIEKDKYGYYAYCPELEGCQTQGDTLEEVLSNLREAIELYLETLSEDEITTLLSNEILTTSLEVKVG